MKKLEIGDLVIHQVATTQYWGIGVVKAYRRHHGLYEVLWSDGTVRAHTNQLLKQIA